MGTTVSKEHSACVFMVEKPSRINKDLTAYWSQFLFQDMLSSAPSVDEDSMLKFATSPSNPFV